MAEAELLQKNLRWPEKFLFLMPTSKPTERAEPKFHLLSVLLQHAHTRTAWAAFCFSPLPPQKPREKGQKQRVYLSPTPLPDSKHLSSWGDLVMNLWRAGFFALNKVRPWPFYWADPLQPYSNHYCVLYWVFWNCSSNFFSPASRCTITARLLPLGSNLDSLWEEAHLWHTKPWEQWQQMSCKAIMSS